MYYRIGGVIRTIFGDGMRHYNVRNLCKVCWFMFKMRLHSGGNAKRIE